MRRPLEFAQCTSAAYEKRLTEHDVVESVSQPGNYWDNAVAESFFSTLKLEVIYSDAFALGRSASPGR